MTIRGDAKVSHTHLNKKNNILKLEYTRTFNNSPVMHVPGRVLKCLRIGDDHGQCAAAPVDGFGVGYTEGNISDIYGARVGVDGKTEIIEQSIRSKGAGIMGC